MRIRDPIHGTIPVDDREKAVIDHRFFQRLRQVKQLGFADLAFPGATHTRYAHSLGAMHVATRLFDVLFPDRFEDGPPPADRPLVQGGTRARFRQAVRLAVLFHDCGHAPPRHTTEMIMPNVGALKLPRPVDNPLRRATHEDYTLKILLDSELARTIQDQFSADGITPADVADLVEPSGDTRWRADGVDYGPLLH